MSSRDRILIRADGLGKVWTTQGNEEIVALSPFDLDIRDGEFLAIVGPSGCGKSTLLKLIAGLIPASSGSVTLDGIAITAPRPEVGLVFQSPMLLPWRTVLENVMLPLELQKRDKRAGEKRARALLEMVGLGDFADRYGSELSGGMQQRAGICRALVHDPEVLLMDEPFGALDAMTRERMNIELQRIWSDQGKTVIFVTHSIQEAVFLGDRVAVMTPRPGQVAEIIDIPLPRPRRPALMATPEFGVLAERIRRHFELEGADL